MNKEQIKELRVYLGLTQIQFARVLHVSYEAVQSWEVGRRNPTGLYLEALLELRQSTLQGGACD